MSSTPASVSKHEAAETPETGRLLALCAVGWLVPGAGHFMLGKTRKAIVFFLVLTFMSLLGLAAHGRMFPLQLSEPLVFLAALAQWTIGLTRLAAAAGGFGTGDVTAVSYEYGNTFLIVAGLLNALVILDIYDIGSGRKPR
jgi:hypothetical protein